MNTQDNSQSWATKDATIPLLISGFISTVLCIGFCVVLYFSRDFINSDIAPRLGWVNPTPTTTALLVSCPAAPTDWTEVMNDKFGPNVHVWPLGKEKDEYGDTNLEIINGTLKLSIKPDKGFYTYYNPGYIGSQRDFYLLTNVRQTGGSSNNEYGVTFRSNGWNHYYFAISNEGSIIIYKHIDTVDGEDIAWKILYQTTSSSVQAGKYNELIVFAQDASFTFCVNQKMVTVIYDDSYVSGDLGIGIDLQKSEDEIIVEYDNFTVYGP